MFCPDDETEDTAAASSPCQEAHLLDDDWDCLERIFKKKDTLHSLIEQAQTAETFSQTLLRIIQEKRLTEPEVYNSVFMDRKLFNKMRNTPEYQPSKRTACLLAVALKLNLEETQAFLGKAGYKLSSWNKFDIIVEYFIANGNYDVFEINEVLAEFKMPLLLRCN